MLKTNSFFNLELFSDYQRPSGRTFSALNLMVFAIALKLLIFKISIRTFLKNISFRKE